ncbi:SMP-30/gluconolactonase/LRE family protein [Lignipirellula cremea]|uniref:Gluconolactonase n=1 Tax=Lignipirellula cremea TaxID=2528010 RepID=A0A518DUE4_9BACT|nr:SMP-30/gluconolactonase/LRE family protein [Lignipirellula cremea]QDU95462.1 Gluconolactonase precursor [Lignipirellula cremea]
MKRFWSFKVLLLGCWLVVSAVAAAFAQDGDKEELFVARALTQPKEFTSGIEGPACDAAGNLYVVNYEKQGTIGMVAPDGKCRLFAQLSAGSVGNGIRFDSLGHMYVADYVNHNILLIDMRSREQLVFAHSDKMNQPNDLAISADDVIYASDPSWAKGTGQVWRIDNQGNVTLAAGDMGTTNGIEVSPDGDTLYVNESKQRKIWAFDITDSGALENKRLIKEFEDFGFDGMRCDVDGNLYVTRHGKGTVIKMTPKGEILKEIDVLGKNPSNICFGGPDGCTAYVTEAATQQVVTFRVDRPGLSWKRWQRQEKRVE